MDRLRHGIHEYQPDCAETNPANCSVRVQYITLPITIVYGWSQAVRQILCKGALVVSEVCQTLAETGALARWTRVGNRKPDASLQTTCSPKTRFVRS